MKEFEAAERYLRRAMEVNPNRGAHYYQLGLIRFRQEQWPAALDFFNKALQLGVGNDEAVVWRSIGDTQAQLVDREAALRAYDTSLHLRPRDAATRLALGRFHLERSESQIAIEHLRAALEIDPALRAAYPLLGRAYRQAQDLPSAAGILKRAVDANPSDQESRYALGQTLLAMGRIDEGRTELEKYDRIRRQVADANESYETGMSRLQAGQLSDAERLLREAVRLAPTYGPALHSLGTLLVDHGSAEQAAEVLRHAVDANPLNAASWFSLGRAYLKTGKQAEALSAVQWAVVLNDEDAQYQHLLEELATKNHKNPR
jgi:tetratricopeptide (TPR) repeat protein